MLSKIEACGSGVAYGWFGYFLGVGYGSLVLVIWVKVLFFFAPPIKNQKRRKKSNCSAGFFCARTDWGYFVRLRCIWRLGCCG